MRTGLPWVCAALLAAGTMALSDPAFEGDRPADSGAPLQAVIEVETTARLLAVLLDSSRSIINENQALFTDPARRGEQFSPEAFEQQLLEMFRGRSGTDLGDLDSTRLPRGAKELLKALVLAGKQVVANAQAEAAQDGVVPAVFTKVASRFHDATGVRLKQTTLAPRNPMNAPDSFEEAALQEFADPSYPREKVISEVTAMSGSLRLMYPLYITRQCLDCHGEPKGERDKTGYPREGLRLGQNAGAISVVIPIHQ